MKHDIIISDSDGTSTIQFSGSLKGICTAEPDVITGTGVVTLSCTPPESVSGYVRIAEPSADAISTGIRVPIFLSTNSIPVTEATEAITMPATTAVPTITMTTADAEPVPMSALSANTLVLAGVLALVFGAVIFYDHRREKKK